MFYVWYQVGDSLCTLGASAKNLEMVGDFNSGPGNLQSPKESQQRFA
jgi:hypothetical protein